MSSRPRIRKLFQLPFSLGIVSRDDYNKWVLSSHAYVIQLIKNQRNSLALLQILKIISVTRFKDPKRRFLHRKCLQEAASPAIL
jgi:hypothetical protein